MNYIKNSFRMTHNYYNVLVDPLYLRYSPWALGEKITRLAERGEAKSIETKRIVDLYLLHHSSWREIPSALRQLVRTVHVITDRGLIEEGLKQGRSSEQYTIYPTLLSTLTPSHD